ncbi:yeats-domain-containing protein [Gonapodya prolifera JEL478]|uniref:Protein AF-9 homolog n=1 Tax=Gonapodya prolifera (strain JEL478) TaxID=1344416 RepID=A0A139AQI8_GONPJ|nr:yeats-domain-containing protein [Gonapodya prolifera JEL478]|eukprot:KXS18924.1 yeats-domain-containing protein [Gonapodya prolifera JEL478]
MMFVCGLPPDDHPETYVRAVRFHVHPSYAPNHIVEVREPPFYLTRFGWGEFPVKVEVVLVDEKRNRTLEFVHELKLDKRNSGAQVLGGEKVYEVELDRHTEFARKFRLSDPAGDQDGTRSHRASMASRGGDVDHGATPTKVKGDGLADFTLLDTVGDDRDRAHSVDRRSRDGDGDGEDGTEDGGDDGSAGPDDEVGSAIYAVSEREQSVPPVPDGIVYEAARAPDPHLGEEATSELERFELSEGRPKVGEVDGAEIKNIDERTVRGAEDQMQEDEGQEQNS